MRGGMQYINFKKINIVTDGDGVTIPGVHQQIEGNHRKLQVATGLSVDGEIVNDFEFFTEVNSGSFTGKTPDGKTVTVTQDDLVTVANAE